MNQVISESDYLLLLSLVDGIGFKTAEKIKHYFGSYTAFFQANYHELKTSNLPYRAIEGFLKQKAKTDIFSYKIWLEKKLIKWISIEDKNYPERLKQIDSPPLVLYYKGHFTPQDKYCLALIGSRQPTSYGRTITYSLVKELSEAGFVIVSGLARGIDSVAHRACLESGGRTIAVLGHGLDLIYPPEHYMLADQIQKSGMLISEYPPGKKPERHQFPARNRIISGLCMGVIITQGASKSGTKTTASFAAQQGREVFCVPGRIDNPLSAGPLELIKIGAKLTTNANDIIEELLPLLPENFIKTNQTKPEFSGDDEKSVFLSLRQSGKTADQLSRELNLPPGKILALLTGLELRRIIRQNPDGQFAVI